MFDTTTYWLEHSVVPVVESATIVLYDIIEYSMMYTMNQRILKNQLEVRKANHRRIIYKYKYWYDTTNLQCT